MSKILAKQIDEHFRSIDPRRFRDAKSMMLVETLIEHGHIEVQTVEIPHFVLTPEIMRKKEAQGLDYFGFHGGERHQQLCADVAFWYEQQGLTWVVEPKTGGRSDLAISNGVRVECGDTEPHKMLDYLMNKDTVLWYPFSSDVAYLLKASPRCAEWLANEQLNELRKAVQLLDKKAS